jgi:hypothetical protein
MKTQQYYTIQLFVHLPSSLRKLLNSRRNELESSAEETAFTCSSSLHNIFNSFDSHSTRPVYSTDFGPPSKAFSRPSPSNGPSYLKRKLIKIIKNHNSTKDFVKSIK